jgi:F-type H+-transporting ATPase subunit b
MKFYYKLIIFLLPGILLANGIVIDFDKTIFIQLFIFIAFGIIIQKLIVNPVVDILDKREDATVGSKDDSKDMIERIESISAEYESKLMLAKKEALIEQDNFIKDVSSKISGKFLLEKNKVDKQIDEFVVKLEKEKLDLKKDLELESKEIAELIIKKVMG